MIGIYKITNKINGKIYIGQSINIENRWNQHIKNIKNNELKTLLYQSMRKYGIENFIFEILEECSSEQLNEKESYWIKYYHSYIYDENCNGYNMTPGGQEKLYNPNTFRKLWDEGYSISEIAKELKHSPTTVVKNLKDYKDYNATNSHKRGGEKIKANKEEIILQYDLNNNFIKEWNSCKEIQKELNINRSSISKVLKGERATAGGFKWYRKNQELNNNKQIRAQREIEQYDLNNNYLNTYKNIAEAAKKIGCDPTNIGKALKGKSSTNLRQTANGYIWKYK